MTKPKKAPQFSPDNIVNQPRQSPIPVLFILNVLIAFVWSTLMAVFGPIDIVIGFAIGLVLLSLVEREYGKRSLRLINFIFYVLWSILVSNINLAWIIIQPRERLQARMDPGIIEIPLTVSNPIEITVLASIITLTPGTLTVDLGTDSQGRNLLYVHNLSVNDPEQFRTNIKEGFENRILQITQGD